MGELVRRSFYPVGVWVKEEVVVCLDGNVKNVEAENLGIRRVGLPGVVTVLDMREVRG